MIHELQTTDFVLYTQEIRKPKNAYEERKVQKDRSKALRWINLFLEDREIILTYKTEDEQKTVIATLKNNNPSRPPLPETPMTEEVINGESVLEDQYVKFYSMPECTPHAIHVDNVLHFYATSNNLIEVSSKLTNVGKRYVKEPVEE